jgi:hypothetical protein
MWNIQSVKRWEMARGYSRIASGLVLVPVAVACAAGCGGSGGGTSSTATSAAKATADAGFTASTLRGALLTQVNGVAAAAPASSGTYSSLTGSSKQATSAVQVTPKACTAAASGFNPSALSASPAAAVSFRVGTNGVSEALIASSTGTAESALAGKIPAECAQVKETIGGKTYTYAITEQAVTGIGQQARALNVQPVGVKSNGLWSLIYQGKGFVGTVTVAGPNASQRAVTELGQQAYAYAVKTLS